ncbi:type III secretion system chaperone [Robbsia sp. KACC 23696]|uniref:type III secretion system chaperone n=1 Tax=Robbsia sp. KACC 23696 TaxID=3149231 RepID=UPI00325B3E12
MRYRNGIDHGQTAACDPLGELGRLCGIDALSLDARGHCSLLLDDLRTINLHWPRGQVWMCLSVELPLGRDAQIDVALLRAAALASAATPAAADATPDADAAHADPSCGGTKRRKRFSPAQY